MQATGGPQKVASHFRCPGPDGRCRPSGAGLVPLKQAGLPAKEGRFQIVTQMNAFL